MAHWTRAKNPELMTGVTDPESILKSVGEEPNPSVQGQMPGIDEHFFRASQTKARICPKLWLRETGTAEETDKAGKVPAATDTVRTKVAV